MPYTIATKFVGRDDELIWLHDRLQDAERLAISAIQGMGGIGKTELALHYAYRSLAQADYPGGVCWLRSREDVGIQIVSFARIHLDLSLPTDLDLSQQVAYCWSHWRDETALLIWDDVTDYKVLQPYLPPGGDRFKVLLTTRLDLGASVRQLRLEVLSQSAALDLLRAIATPERIDAQLADAEALCEWVGYLPLGLELVARYLARKPDLAIAQLLQRLQDKRLDAKALKQTAPGMTASLGVAAAFELSWQGLSESAQQLAGWLSLFALAPIQWDLVSACLPESDTEDLEDLRDDELLGLHLLERTEQGMYQLHQLLREFFAAKRQQMAIEEEMKRSVCRVLVNAAEYIPQALTLTLVAQFTPLIPHLVEVTTHLAAWLTDEDLIEPYIRIARFYEGQAAYKQAQPWLTQGCTVAEIRLGADHPTTATSLNNLAGLYYSQGRYSEAEPLYVRSLSIRETQLGAAHPDVAQSLNNLAALYELQGRYPEAEPLYLRSLSIWETQLGVAHPHVATNLNNLANLYRSQGRYPEAEPLYLRSLSIWEMQLGVAHPHVATNLNNLANLYRSQGRYPEAEPLYLRSLSIWKMQLGVAHPDVAQSLNNLAELYRLQGRYLEAEPLHLRSLSIRETQLGAAHPDTAISCGNLAGIYESTGLYDKAESLCKRALNIHEQQLGENHPHTATSLNKLARLYQLQGRYSEAEPLYLRSLSIWETHLGAAHPEVATSLNNLAELYQSKGRYSEAEPLYLRSLSIYEMQLGAVHPHVATSLNNLAALYESQGRYPEAEPLYLRALAILFERLGEIHPNTQTGWRNFVGCLQQAIHAGQAAQLSNHPATQGALEQLRRS